MRLSSIVIGLLIVTFILWSRITQCALECENIKNTDRRNYCRALSDKQPSWCEFIKNNDLRHQCRAMIKLH